MNSLSILFVVLAAKSLQEIDEIYSKMVKRQNESSHFVFPGEDGKNYLVDTKAPIKFYAAVNNCSDCNEYWLYTRSNPTSKQVLKYKDEESVKKSNYDPKKVTVFISHGWKGEVNSEINVVLTRAFLKQGDVNVIVLDWSKLSKDNYITARYAVPVIGELYGQFIDWLQFSGMSLNKVHLVGHSLGGHVVSNAGKILKGKAKRLTALDPAWPLFTWKGDDRLSRTDAQYVEVIHTHIYITGYPFALGHSDHYPNGGTLMPGCYVWDAACHHARSWQYMAASVEGNTFNANKCPFEVSTWTTWKVMFKTCDGPVGLMGNSDINKSQNGTYKMRTLKDYPYNY